MTTSTTTIRTRSIIKAPARVPAEPSSRRRSTPSGVMKVRLRVRGWTALVAMRGPPHRPGVEISEPANQHRRTDQRPQTVIVDRLPPDAFEQSGDREHD